MRTAVLLALAALVACAPVPPDGPAPAAREGAVATFAGGCFWCMEPPFENREGVLAVTSGYAGGQEHAPTYEEVSSGETGHREAVQVTYDPAKVSYRELLDIYWRQIDPADAQGSFVDRGLQYTSAIFYHDEEQRRLAQESKEEVERRLGQPVATQILPYTTFYPAEEYHQDYYRKNPLRYKYYRSQSGRDDYIAEVWHKDNRSLFGAGGGEFVMPSDEELRQRLTPLQYHVARENGTEPAFRNEHWNNEEDGIYVDVVSGEPLFSSKDKYDSGTGWPSFTRPLEPANIVTREDRKLFSVRTEVRSRQGDSHLGHVFPDGPPPTGLRYCMNSASLRFIPKDRLEEEGYGEYLKLFG